MSSSLSLVQRIEAEAGKSITINSECNAYSLRMCHPQERSILFSLPQELRYIVWHHALGAPSTPDLEFADNPDLAGGRQRFHTNLLLTCRRIWLEANAISFPKIVHRSWHQGGECRTRNLIEKLTVLNRSRINALHVILEGCWIGFSKDYNREELPPWPSKLIVSIMSWPWEMIPFTREIGNYFEIYIADLLLDETVRNTNEVEFHLEERVEKSTAGMSRHQSALSRLLDIQRRNLGTAPSRDSQLLNNIAKYWELQPVNSEPCRYWTRRIPDDRPARPEDSRNVEYLTHTFTFQRIAAFPDDYSPTATVGYTTRGRPAVARTESTATSLTRTMHEEQNRQCWETRWEGERSLLKFAP